MPESGMIGKPGFAAQCTSADDWADHLPVEM
jgi:hypothetical protein